MASRTTPKAPDPLALLRHNVEEAELNARFMEARVRLVEATERFQQLRPKHRRNPADVAPRDPD